MFSANLDLTVQYNNKFRKTIFTSDHMQIVCMALKPAHEIGEEIHQIEDQLTTITQGSAVAIVDGVDYALEVGDSILIPHGVKHNIINASNQFKLKLWSIYSPPEEPLIQKKTKSIIKVKEKGKGNELHNKIYLTV